MLKPWESEKGIFCPVNGWDCPYYYDSGKCGCKEVEKECDDFYFFWSEEIDAETGAE